VLPNQRRSATPRAGIQAGEDRQAQPIQGWSGRFSVLFSKFDHQGNKRSRDRPVRAIDVLDQKKI
jgi:hypothetical protein